MKKTLVKKITLSILAGAILFGSNVVWAAPETSVSIDDGKSSAWTAIVVNSGRGGSTTPIENASADGKEGAVAIGDGANVSDANAIAIGAGANVSNANAIAIGAKTSVGGIQSIAFGFDAKTSGFGGNTAIGSKSESTGAGSSALGYGTQALGDGSVALGYYSVATDNYVVSVGSGNIDHASTCQYRKIVNVADGSIAAGSHEAITGGQLYTELGKKANASDVYTKYQTYSMDEADNRFATQVELTNELALKADKTFVVAELGKKANANDVYTKGETDTAITSAVSGKADKTFVDTELGKKADKSALETETNARIAGDTALQQQIDNIGGGSSEAITGLNQRLGKLGNRLDKVGAGAAALAALHPLEYDPDDKLTFSAGMGNYAGENAAALGAFYRPNEKFMVSLGGTMGNGENMVNLGISVGLDKPNGFAKMSKRELIQEVNTVKAENEAIKAEMAEMKAMLQALMAKK